MFRGFLKEKEGAGLLTAIVLLIAIMMAVAVSSVIIFAFLGSTEGAYEYQDTFDVVSYLTDETLSLSANPDTSTVTIDVYNSSSSSWGDVSDAYVSVSGRIVTVNASAMDANSSQLRADYSIGGYDTNSDIIAYAVIVFGLLVIVPLVVVGGLMLRSLGFFSGGGKI